MYQIILSKGEGGYLVEDTTTYCYGYGPTHADAINEYEADLEFQAELLERFSEAELTPRMFKQARLAKERLEQIKNASIARMR